MKYKYTALTASIFYIIYGYAGIANATVQDDVIAPNYIQTPELTVNNINSSGLIAANLINANDLTANAINVNGGVSSTSQNTVTQTVQNVYFTDDYGNYAGSAIQYYNGLTNLYLSGDNTVSGTSNLNDTNINGTLITNNLQINGTLSGVSQMNINDLRATGLSFVDQNGQSDGSYIYSQNGITNLQLYGNASINTAEIIDLTAVNLKVNGTLSGVSRMNVNDLSATGLSFVDQNGQSDGSYIYSQNGHTDLQLNGNANITTAYVNELSAGKLTTGDLQVNGQFNINDLHATGLSFVDQNGQSDGSYIYSQNGHTDLQLNGNANITTANINELTASKLTTGDLQVNGTLTGINQMDLRSLNTSMVQFVDQNGQLDGSYIYSQNGHTDLQLNGNANITTAYVNELSAGKLTTGDLQVNGQFNINDLRATGLSFVDQNGQSDGSYIYSQNGHTDLQLNGNANITTANINELTASKLTTGDLQVNGALKTNSIDVQNNYINHLANAVDDHQAVNLGQVNGLLRDSLIGVNTYTDNQVAILRQEASVETARVNQAITDGDIATLASANKTTADTATALRQEASVETARVNQAITDGDKATLASANKTTADTAAALRQEASIETARVNQAITDGDIATLASANKTIADTAAVLRQEASAETARVNQAITDGDKATLASANKTTADTATVLRQEASAETARVNQAITDGDKATLASANKTTADTAAALRQEASVETARVNQAITDGDKATLASANKTTADTAAALRQEASVETARVNQAITDGDKATLVSANKTTADTAAVLRQEASAETARVNQAITDGDKATLASANKTTADTATVLRQEASTESARVNQVITDGDKATLASANKNTADTVAILRKEALAETGRLNTVISEADANTLAQAKAYTDANLNGSPNVAVSSSQGLQQATASGQDSIAIGQNASTGTGGASALAMGHSATANGASSIALGSGAQALGVQTVSIGTGNIVSGDRSGALGDPNIVSGSASYAFGNDNTISGDNTFVLGNNVNTSAQNTVVLGNNSSSTRNNTVSVGSTGSERQITNVKAGTIDTDAVNLKQMKDADQTILASANAFTNETAKTIRSEATAESARINSVIAKTGVDTLASAKSYTDTQVSVLDSRVSQLNSRVGDVEKTSYRGIAIALAAQQQIPNFGAGQFAVFGGAGHYEGESAAALGLASVLADGRTSFSAALGFAGGNEVGGRVGVSYVFGGK